MIWVKLIGALQEIMGLFSFVLFYGYDYGYFPVIFFMITYHST